MYQNSQNYLISTSKAQNSAKLIYIKNISFWKIRNIVSVSKNLYCPALHSWQNDSLSIYIHFIMLLLCGCDFCIQRKINTSPIHWILHNTNPLSVLFRHISHSEKCVYFRRSRGLPGALGSRLPWITMEWQRVYIKTTLHLWN